VSDRRATRPLNVEAVKAANAAVAGETGGRPLTTGLEDADLRKKWMDAYIEAGGNYETIASGGRTPANPTQPCPAGTNGPFVTQDDAARAALQTANPQSIRDNREYAGLIYRGTDEQYYFTGPVQGTDQGANPQSAPAPSGTQVIGDYHTHGDYSTADPDTGAAVRTSDPARDDFDSDNFSTDDKDGIASDGASIPGYAGYLGTPSGTFKRYDPTTGSDTTL
jgi:hypothetical protein